MLLFIIPVGCNRTGSTVQKQSFIKFSLQDEFRFCIQSPSIKRCFRINNETRFYTDLSSQFNFRLTIFNNDFNTNPTGSVLKIYTKSGKFMQKIELTNNLMFPLNLKEAYSFETQANLPFQLVTDNLYGTLVIEDFNFDNLYDIALMEGCAANGNARYYYYLQSEDSVFAKDIFLRKEITTYPAVRDVKRKQLTSANISFRSCTKTTVQYNDSLKSWKKIKEVVYE